MNRVKTDCCAQRNTTSLSAAAQLVEKQDQFGPKTNLLHKEKLISKRHFRLKHQHTNTWHFLDIQSEKSKLNYFLTPFPAISDTAARNFKVQPWILGGPPLFVQLHAGFRLKAGSCHFMYLHAKEAAHFSQRRPEVRLRFNAS